MKPQYKKHHETCENKPKEVYKISGRQPPVFRFLTRYQGDYFWFFLTKLYYTVTKLNFQSYEAHRPSYNLTPPISGVLIGRYQRVVTHLENVRQSNIARGKKLVFQMSNDTPSKLENFVYNSINAYIIKFELQSWATSA